MESKFNFLDPSTYYIYLTTNKVNNKQYVGQHKLSSGIKYLGSGTEIKLDIEKFGKENFSNEILDWSSTTEEAFYLESYYSYIYETYDPLGYNSFHSLKAIDEVYEYVKYRIKKI